MEKIKLSSFMPAAATDSTCTAHGVDFAVRYTVPYEELLGAIQHALALIANDEGYVSVPIRTIVSDLMLLKYYTNIDLAAIELANITQEVLYETYDIAASGGPNSILSLAKQHIEPTQLSFYYETLNGTLESAMEYRNSIAGLLEVIAERSGGINNDIKSSIEEFNDPEKMANIMKIAEMMHANTAT